MSNVTSYYIYVLPINLDYSRKELQRYKGKTTEVINNGAKVIFDAESPGPSSTTPAETPPSCGGFPMIDSLGMENSEGSIPKVAKPTNGLHSNRLHCIYYGPRPFWGVELKSERELWN